MATQNSIQVTDYSNEKSSFGVTSVTVNAGNIVAQQAAAATLVGAVDDLTIGAITKQGMNLVILDAPALPTDPYAQRELKWLVSYQGAVSGKIFQLEIPAPDITDNVVPNSDVADLTSTDWDNFITAFEAFAKSPDNGTEAVAVIKAVLVGRNL